MKDFRAPGELDAQRRAWTAVAAAFADREPAQVRRHVPVRPLVALAVVAAVAAVAATPPGHAVLTSVRKAIGIEHAAKALYALPAHGHVLAGDWVVNADGSTRRLGSWRETSWSPFGRYVVAASGDELAAVTPTGQVRWALARRDVRFPRWGGTHVDTRIAYLSGDRLRVVAGDGTNDREVGPAAAAPVAPAWRPGGAPFTLAYADVRGHVWVFQPDTGKVLFRTAGGPLPTTLAWSADGARLLVLRPAGLAVYDAAGRRVADVRGRYVDAAWVGSRVALLSRHAVSLGGRTLFRTTGRLAQVAASPDGRWLLVTWPEADQWLFVPTGPGRRLTAVGNIREQLGGGFPVAGWTP